MGGRPELGSAWEARVCVGGGRVSVPGACPSPARSLAPVLILT